jgi:heme-binding NEAT domain protein
MKRIITIVALIAVAITVAACGGATSAAPSASEMEKTIKVDLQAQLDKRNKEAMKVSDYTTDSKYIQSNVQSVDCVKNKETVRCFAEVKVDEDGDVSDERLGITVTPGDDGSYLWEVG